MAAASINLDAAQTLADKFGSEIKLVVREARLGFQGRRSHDAGAVNALRALKKELADADHEWRAARVGVDISALLINTHDGPGAEIEAREAMKIFAKYEDSYGVEIARRNLVSALLYQDGKDHEIDEHIRALNDEALSVDNRRHRAWLCNVLVKRRRADGKPDEAIGFAREAIAHGKDLGDDIIVAINLIGLANALSDKEAFDEAIACYQEASTIAQKLARRDIEAHASYLIANTYNDLPISHPESKKAPSLAEHHALHAIGLLRNTIGQDHLARAYDALGDSLQPHRNLEAARAYFAGAAVLRSLGKWDRFESMLMQGAYLSQLDIETYCQGFRSAFDVHRPPNNDVLVRKLFDPLDEILLKAPQNVLMPFLGVHFKLLFEQLPAPIARHLFDLTFSLILETELKDPTEVWRIAYPLIVLLACAGKYLTSYDLYRISSAIEKVIQGLTVRNTTDLGAFWYVELSYDSPVMLTIFAMDDELHSELAALVIALFMKGFENEFRQEIFGGIPLRSELALEITDIASVPEDIKATIVEALGDSPCQSTRPSHVEFDSSKMPTYIFLSGNIFADMKVGEGKGGPLQVLLGIAAIEVAHRLLGSAIELDVLQPKLVELVRSSIS